MTTTAPWGFPDWGDAVLADRAAAAAGDVRASLDLATGLGERADALGTRTWSLFSTLATLGAVDLTTARTVEPHLDALTILGQAGADVPGGSTWGVYASATGASGLQAVPAAEDGWALTGTKGWCSLAGEVSHALVTAPTTTGGHRLFAVALGGESVTVEAGRWVPHGLRAVTTGSLTFHETPATPVGPDGWYLSRPGFAWGGIGVAAVWFGGAAALAGALWAAAERRPPDQVALVHLGAVDATLHACLLALRDAAAAVDAGVAGPEAMVLAARVRALVAEACDQVLSLVGRALGPAPLAMDETHAARVADLGLYVRQHHAERDLAALGSLRLPADTAAGAGE